jgi:hypothetical protein
MSQFGPLGIFLILSFILPGLIITSGLIIFFPEIASVINAQGGIEFIGIVILISFINGQPAFLFERYVLDPLWNKIFPKWRMKERNKLTVRRSKIIANAEIKGLTHNHYDQTIGEFILFNNTGLWLFFIAAARLVRGPHSKMSMIALLVLFASVISLVFVSPFFKKSYTDILEALDTEVQRESENNISDAEKGEHVT